MRSSVVFALGLATAVSAQSNYTQCCDIEPSSVDINTRNNWCIAQQHTCPSICDNGATLSNACDPNALTYNCTCLTGITPNISSYQQTLPSLQCEAWVAQCVVSNANNLVGQTFCHSNICGSKIVNAPSVSSTSTASSSAAASTSGSGPASSTSAAASSSTSAAAAAVLRFGQEYGTKALLAGIVAVFGFAL